MSPKQALESATRVGAELMGIDNEVGTIEVGKKADMVLIDGDPLSDPGALRNVWAVYQSRFSGRVSTSVSKRLMLLVLAAGLSGPRQPAMTFMAGSWAIRSASLVSS